MTGHARAFLDTNILIYATDADAGPKYDRARSVLDAHRSGAVISTQVLVEFHSVCTRKLGMTKSQASSAVRLIAQLPVIDADRSLVLQATELAAANQLSIFDAMIVAAARRSDCPILLTEDLTDGQDFGGTIVTNPFTGLES